MADAEILCFHCGLPVQDPPLLNELEDGEICPICRDRAMAALPPIFHAPFGAARSPEAHERDEEPSERRPAPRPELVVDEDDERHDAGS